MKLPHLSTTAKLVIGGALLAGAVYFFAKRPGSVKSPAKPKAGAKKLKGLSQDLPFVTVNEPELAEPDALATTGGDAAGQQAIAAQQWQEYQQYVQQQQYALQLYNYQMQQYQQAVAQQQARAAAYAQQEYAQQRAMQPVATVPYNLTTYQSPAYQSQPSYVPSLSTSGGIPVNYSYSAPAMTAVQAKDALVSYGLQIGLLSITGQSKAKCGANASQYCSYVFQNNQTGKKVNYAQAVAAAQKYQKQNPTANQGYTGVPVTAAF